VSLVLTTSKNQHRSSSIGLARSVEIGATPIEMESIISVDTLRAAYKDPFVDWDTEKGE
jgi:hypothetical protein